MGNPIKHSVLIEKGNPFTEPIAGAKELVGVLKLLRTEATKPIKITVDNIKGSQANTKQGQSALAENSKELNAQIRLFEKLNAKTLEATSALNTLKKAQAEYNKLSDQARQEFAKNTEALRRKIEMEKIDAKIMASAPNSIERMKAELAKLRAEWNKTDMGTKRFKELEQQIGKTTETLKKHEAATGSHQRNVGNYGGIFDKVGKGVNMLSSAWMGWGLAITAVGGLLVKMISPVESLKDKWEEMTTGMKFGWDQTLRAISTGDFSNFTERIKEAIELGVEYARVLDTLEDRVNSVSIRESELNNAIDKERLALKNVNLTTEERQKHIEKLKTLEKGLADDKLANAKILYDAEIKNLQFQTGLSKGIIENYLKQNQAFSPLINQAQIYNEALKKRDEYKERAEASNKGVVDKLALTEYQKYSKVVDETSDKVKGFAHIVELMGNANEDTKTKVVEAWVAMNNVTHEYNQAVEKATTTGNKLEKKENDITDKINSQTDALKENSKAWLNNTDAFKNATDQGGFGIENGLSSQESPDKLKGKGTPQAENTPINMPGQLDKIDNKNWAQLSSIETFDGTDLEKFQANLQSKLGYIQDFANAASQALGMLSDKYKQQQDEELKKVEGKYDGEKAALDAQLAGKRISQRVYDQKMIELEKKKNAEKEKIEKDYRKKQKQVALIQAIINTAVGVTGSLAQGGIMGIIMAAITLALGVVEIATISSQTFAKGGHGKIDKNRGGVLQGKRHSQGGVSLGDLGEAEQGEYFAVINRRATSKYKDVLPLVFDALNQQRFDSMFSPKDVNIKFDGRDPYNKLIYEALSRPKPETKIIDTGKYILRQTGNYTERISK